MGRKQALTAGKHLIYCLGLILCYVLQTTPGFLQIFGVKPFLVIPAVIAIAMQEGEFTGALYGALGGMLCDLGANTFYGFYTLTLFLYGAAVGLMLIYLMKNDNWMLLVLKTGAVTFDETEGTIKANITTDCISLNVPPI